MRLFRLAPSICAVALCNSAHAQTLPASTSRTVLVHLDGDEDATLQAKDGDDWVTICRAPCNERVGADALFRVSGFDVRNSAPFELRSEAGASQIVRVDSTSTGGYVIGSTLVVLGAIGVTTGVVLDFLGVETESCQVAANIEPDGSDAPSTCEKPWHNLSDIGIGIGIASLVGLAGGVALMIANGHSSVTQSASRAVHSHIAILGLSTRKPLEVGGAAPAGVSSRSTFPVAATTPVLTVSF
ncbi:MAG: hypothetical protein ACRELY_31500 [Polyangiaceae bacterium]